MKDKPIIGITMGDPSGIGPEVIAKSIRNSKITDLGRIIVIGDKFVFSKVSRSIPANIAFVDLDNVSKKNFSFGKIRLEFGKAAVQYLDYATGLLKRGEINCLVTAPISKEAINLAGYHYSGHTEYLYAKTKSKDIAMMFSTPKLKVTLVTRHLSLKEAIAQLNIEKISCAIALTRTCLIKNFRIKNPRIGVCGLNPHAGESGLLGEEEERIISPAVKKANKKHRNIFGPIAAGAIFHQALNGKFDALIALYHDQALIPIKTFFSDLAVNITLGLPFVRTSPSHGTAFDIAGKNIANPSSMKEAIKLASYLCRK